MNIIQTIDWENLFFHMSTSICHCTNLNHKKAFQKSAVRSKKINIKTKENPFRNR